MGVAVGGRWEAERGVRSTGVFALGCTSPGVRKVGGKYGGGWTRAHAMVVGDGWEAQWWIC